MIYTKVKRPSFLGTREDVEKEFRKIAMAFAEFYKQNGVPAGKAEELVRFQTEKALRKDRRLNAERIRKQNALDAEEAFYRELRDGEQ